VERLRRLTLPALLGLAFYYAVFGGEHSWLDLRRARTGIDSQTVGLAALRSDIDSLQARADSLENDSATLERVARERYGMVRKGEILYRFAEPGDSAEDADDAGGSFSP